MAVSPHIWAKALFGAGGLAHAQCDYIRAHEHYEASLRIRREIGDRAGIASALNSLGLIAYEQGSYASANALYEECLALCRELGHTIGIAVSLNNLGLMANDQERLCAGARAL